MACAFQAGRLFCANYSVIDDRVLFLVCCFVFDFLFGWFVTPTSRKRRKRTIGCFVCNFGVHGGARYSCLQLTSCFVAEIPRNAATIKYRFLLNQVSCCAQGAAAHTEQNAHVQVEAHWFFDQQEPLGVGVSLKRWDGVFLVREKQKEARTTGDSTTEQLETCDKIGGHAPHKSVVQG